MFRLFFLTVFSIGLLFTFATNNDAHAESKAEGEAGVMFVELNPLILPVINKYGATSMVSLVVAVEVASEENAEKVKKYQPRLADAYLSDLYGSLSQQVPDSGIVPIAFLKERLNVMSKKVLGDHVVNDVLVQVMQKRPT